MCFAFADLLSGHASPQGPGIDAYGPIPPRVRGEETSGELLLPVHLRKGDVDVRLFSVISTIGSALDLTPQQLRLETSPRRTRRARGCLPRWARPSIRSHRRQE